MAIFDKTLFILYPPRASAAGGDDLGGYWNDAAGFDFRPAEQRGLGFCPARRAGV